MPSKQSSKSGGGGNKGSNGGKGNGGKSNTSSATASAAASAAPPPASATAASPATAPSFDSLPHATSGERLKGVEVGSTIPALMSELGVLLQQTPGGPGGNISGSAAAGLLPRGQNGGLLFEDVDFANSLNDAAGLGAGDDVSRRFDQIPPKALERLSQVFKLQHRQAQQAQQAAAAAAAAAAAQASVSSKGGSNAGSPSVEAVDSDDDVDAETDGDGTSAGGGGGSSRGTGHTTPAPANAAAPMSYGGNNTNSNSNNSSNPAGVAGGDYEGYSAAGRRHNLEEMFEMMQRSLGNYARGAAAAAAAGGGAAGGGGGMGSGAYFAAGFNSVDAKEKGMGSGAGSGGGALAGEMSLDPSAYSDPLTQLELFRAMMVATSKGRGLAGGLDGKGEDVDLRTRSQRNSAAAAAGGGGSGAAGGGNGVGVGAGPGGGSALSAGNGGVGTGLSVGARGVAGGGLDMQSNNPFQSFLDVLGPQLFGQMRVQPRGGAAAAANKAAAMAAGKDQDGGLTGGGISPAAAAAAAVAAREVDLSPNGAANLSDLQKRVEQVRVLSSSTLEELAADEVSDSTSGNLRDLLLGDGEGGLMAPSAAAAEPELSSAKVGYCLTEAAAVAVSMLWSYLHYLEKGLPQPPGWSREAAQSEFNQLLFRLRQELASHSPANLAEIARCFGGGVMADAEDVYRAINGVGVLLFFTCKPLPLLEKACAELGISLSDSANADSNVMPELIAEKLAAFFYPMKEGKLTFAHLSFIPRVQVHEHAPGNYTCTIDNASNMGRMLRERLISNRFSCNKIKWRAAIVNDNDELQFLVWHRYSTPLSVHVLVRTSEPKKKKRSGSAKDGSAAAAMAAGVGGGGGGNNNHNNNGEERETSATEELRATSALFLERQVTAAPGEMIGFTDDFLGLKVALNSPTTLQHGYRTYNKADDRLVFQFSLQLSNLDGTSLDGASANANRAGSKQATPQAQPQDAQGAGNDADPSINGSMAGRTDGGDSKEDAEAELRAVVRVFVDTETAARAVIAETAHLEYRHLQNDECRDAHQSRRRAEERERKALLAKVGPPPELLREVEKLSQAVQAAQQQISKLNKERAKEDKENEKMSEKLAQQQGDLSKLHSTLSSNEKELARLEEETKAAERRIEEKKARLARKEAKRTEQDQWTALKHVLEPTSSSTHHDTLAINDFGSFLQSSSMASATQQHPQQPQQPSLSGSNVYSLSGNIGGGMPPLGGSGGSLSNLNSNNNNNVGGLSAFGTDPFSVRQATTTPPSAAANTTPVFSTQPKMGMATSSSLGTNNNGGVGGGGGGGGGSVAGGSSHHPLLDSVGGGGGSSSASTHPGMVSPMVPPSPGVASNASAAMGSRNSPASAVAASLGSPGMPLNNNNNGGGMGGRGSASPSSVMMMGGVGAPTMSMNMNNNNNGGGLGPSIGGGGGGGLAFGLAPSLFSTNPVSHASHANMGNNNNMGPGGSANNLYTSLDVNAQPFSPSPPPGSPGTASNSNHSHGAGSNHNGMGNNNNNNNNGGGGGGFNFTVTAGAGMHPVLGGSPSPLYQAGQGAFSSNGHDLGPHSPSPFSTTSMSTGGNGLFMVNNNNNNSAGNAVGGGGGGNGNGGGMHGGPGDLSHHQGMFPPQPHSPNEMLSFSTSLQWRN